MLPLLDKDHRFFPYSEAKCHCGLSNAGYPARCSPQYPYAKALPLIDDRYLSHAGLSLHKWH